MSSRTEIDFKSFTIDDLQPFFSGVPFKVTPKWHQYASLAFAASGPKRVGYFHDVATGKTPLALMTAVDLWQFRKIFIACPTSALGAWDKWIRESTNLKTTFLCDNDTSERRKRLVQDKHDIYVIHYEGLKTLFSQFRPYAKFTCPYCFRSGEMFVEDSLVLDIQCPFCKRTIEKEYAHGAGTMRSPFQVKKRWVVDPTSIPHFDCVVFDEAHRCSSHDSLQSEICLKLSTLAKATISLTGTPTDKSLLDLFNVMLVTDLGQSLGTSFYAYRAKYFQKPPWGFDWELKEHAQEKILERIRPSVISFGIDECWDLPQVVEEIRSISIPAALRERQEELRKKKSIKVLGKTIMFKPEAVIERLRQICDGFMYVDDGERASVRFPETPKVDALIDLIDEAGNQKVIVFYHYQEDLKIITERFNKEKLGYVAMCGGQTVDERRQAEKVFQTTPGVHLIAQQSVANEGFDGTAAKIVVFYNPVGSPRIRTQCHGRIRRPGVEKETKLVSIDLVIAGTVEELVIKNRGPRFNFVRDCMKFLRE